ncbi:MAG: lysophospholipid acyltransferase family protein [Candidatus Melainabacteria bacterium]|nr:lysophospholipid acyltransferase family protein [Candidatus Melainabacteria bacterium]
MPPLPDILIPILAVVSVFLLSTTALIFRMVQGRVKYWEPHVEKVRQGGYVPPQPYFLTALLMRTLCIILGFLEVGPIKILGRNRLPKSGPTIIAPFHVDAGDGSIISSLLGIRTMYYLIRTTEVTGLRGWIGTLTGAIAVDEESQEGRAKAFKAAISALANGGPDVTMIIFPQGQLVPDEEVRRTDFKSGTMAIAKLAARKRKEPIWIVPIGVHYRTDPSEATMFQKAVQALGFKKFRNLFGHQNYGAYAIVGKPFKVTPKAADLDEIARGLTLQDDADKATDSYVQRLMILQKAAKKRSAARRRSKHEKSTT